ncbi:MAG: ribonuclease HII [Bacteroidia bacterium]
MLTAFYNNEVIEAGCDEAGRGCLAGPVFAAAVILPVDFYHPLLNDSKQMKESDRDELRIIIELEALAYSVAKVEADEIDRINILNASFKAMHLAIEQLKITPELLLIDGNRFKKYRNIKHQCIIGGDGIYQAIAAASVLAKTYRDDYMKQLHDEFPRYGWFNNKAYATPQHITAIKQFGQTIHHRKSFVLKPKQFELFEKEI